MHVVWEGLVSLCFFVGEGGLKPNEPQRGKELTSIPATRLQSPRKFQTSQEEQIENRSEKQKGPKKTKPWPVLCPLLKVCISGKSFSTQKKPSGSQAPFFVNIEKRCSTGGRSHPSSKKLRLYQLPRRSRKRFTLPKFHSFSKPHPSKVPQKLKLVSSEKSTRPPPVENFRCVFFSWICLRTFKNPRKKQNSKAQSSQHQESL